MVVKQRQDVEGVRAAAQCVVRAHERLVEFLRAGLTLPEVDGFVARTLEDLNCRSCFLGYKIRGHPPFPSHACLSLNDCIVHGTHHQWQRALQPGDVLSIDIGVKHRGWIGDAAWTYAIEHASNEALALMQCGRESLARGLAALVPGRPLRDWAAAVQGYVEGDCGFHLVTGLGGHGFGRSLHGPPFVSNLLPGGRHRVEWPEANLIMQPGMLLAVEPMLAIGTGETRSKGREWPIFTADGSLAVHYEADVMIDEEGGPVNLTEGLELMPDVVG
jgi:methionyl aminopeptidase